MSAQRACRLPTPDHGAAWESIDWEALVDAAVRCREQAYAPYSDFRVGAALLARNGAIYIGCNVENRVLGLSLCAERGALSAAVADGQRSLLAMALATGAAPPSAPCGQCRDALAEFGCDLPVVSVTAGVHASSHWRRFTLHELLPAPFVLDREEA